MNRKAQAVMLRERATALRKRSTQIVADTKATLTRSKARRIVRKVLKKTR